MSTSPPGTHADTAASTLMVLSETFSDTDTYDRVELWANHFSVRCALDDAEVLSIQAYAVWGNGYMTHFRTVVYRHTERIAP